MSLITFEPDVNGRRVDSFVHLSPLVLMLAGF